MFKNLKYQLNWVKEAEVLKLAGGDEVFEDGEDYEDNELDGDPYHPYNELAELGSDIQPKYVAFVESESLEDMQSNLEKVTQDIDRMEAVLDSLVVFDGDTPELSTDYFAEKYRLDEQTLDLIIDNYNLSFRIVVDSMVDLLDYVGRGPPDEDELAARLGKLKEDLFNIKYVTRILHILIRAVGGDTDLPKIN